jgi:hypothetical protein
VLYILLMLKAKKPATYRMLQSLPLLDFGFTVNLFDIMYVVARRRN